jgi:hypothetical protein
MENDKWLNCMRATSMGEEIARALLKKREPWSSVSDKDIFLGVVSSGREGDLLIWHNEFSMAHHLAHRWSRNGLVWQRWTLKMKGHPEDMNQCRILSVELD